MVRKSKFSHDVYTKGSNVNYVTITPEQTPGTHMAYID